MWQNRKRASMEEECDQSEESEQKRGKNIPGTQTKLPLSQFFELNSEELKNWLLGLFTAEKTKERIESAFKEEGELRGEVFSILLNKQELQRELAGQFTALIAKKVVDNIDFPSLQPPPRAFAQSVGYGACPDAIERYLGEFAEQYRQVGTVTLEELQAIYGTVLRYPFPSLLKERAMDPMFLHPIGTAADKLLELLQKQYKEETQTRKLIGIADTSGAGKTKVYFSLALLDKSEFSVVFIRLYDASVSTLPFEVLELQILTDQARARDAKTEEEKIECARTGHDKVKLYIASHVRWLLDVSNKLGLRRGLEQRKAWLYALRNGLGNQGTAAIFNSLVDSYNTCADKHTFADTSLSEMLYKAVADFGPLLFAFDEIGHAQGKGNGLFYHFDDYVKRAPSMHQRKDEEFSKPTGSSNQRADLFYMFRVQMKRLLSDYRDILIAMSDTRFSMHDVIEHNSKSPLNDLVVPWAEFHSCTAEDLYSFFERYLLADSRYKPELTTQLRRFEGRPHFFFVTLRSKLFALCMERPTDEAHLWDLLEKSQFFDNCFKECVGLFCKNVIGPHWNTNSSYDPSSPTTVSNDMKMLHLALVMGNRKVIIRNTKRLKDLISTGLLFAPELSTKAVAHPFKPVELDLEREPVVAEALRQYGASKLKDDSDHILQCFSHLLSTADQQSQGSTTALKGDVTELLLAWIVIKQTSHYRWKNALSADVPVPLKQILKPLLPCDFVWPEAFDDTTVAVSLGTPLDKGDPYAHLFESNAGTASQEILFDIDKRARADIVFLHETAGSPGICAIQCKAKQVVDFQDALWSVTPGCQYFSTKRDQISLLYDNPMAVEVKKSKQRRKFEECMRQRPDVQNRWLRGIFSIKNWHSNIIEAINKANTETCPTQPIILLQASEELFQEAFEILRESVRGKVDYVGERPSKTWCLAPLKVE